MTLADRGGIESLTMRKLATDLDIEAASSYCHVRNRGGLLDGVVDIVFGEMERPTPGEDPTEEWKAAMGRR